MTFDILPFPRSRELIIDAFHMASKRHIVHGFLEVDVTMPRYILKRTAGSDGRPLSFTGFVIASFARAIHAHPTVHAYRDFRNRLIVFHDVDVSTVIEPRPGAQPIPHIIRSADTRSVREISEEIRAVQADPHPWGQFEKNVALAARVPRFVRILFFHALKLKPNWVKQVEGTAEVSSFGMFGKRPGWGIGFLNVHTIGLWVGGIAVKPMAHEGNIALRDCLHVTLSLDHDIVDGAPAARFASTFAELLESGAALDGEIT
ncbi:MAG: 2-oxo acid dehydrogenase subunit E2 [Chloroflexi bacterium]|nr:2-oxo acid dehydrogenase subunit E2 [Chloroflexota bacterium]